MNSSVSMLDAAASLRSSRWFFLVKRSRGSMRRLTRVRARMRRSDSSVSLLRFFSHAMDMTTMVMMPR